MFLRKISIYLCLTVLFWGCENETGLIQTEPALKESWEKYNVENMGSIHIPPTLELQSKSINREVSKYANSNNFTLSDKRVVFQQKGFNNSTKLSENKYARVIIETMNGSEGEFDSLTYKPTDLDELDMSLLIDVNNSFKNTNIKLVNWVGTERVIVNGKYSIKYEFVRQLKDNPPVSVQTYLFSNYDRIHTVTVSYRISEKSFWESDFKSIINSIQITNFKNNKSDNIVYQNSANNEQIALVLAKNAWSYGYSRNNEDHIKSILKEREGDIKIQGWETFEIDKETILIGFLYTENDQKRGWALEVKPEYELVREVWQDSILSLKYRDILINAFKN